MKKLIKRLEELAVENEKLRNVIEEHVIDCFKEKFKDSIFEQMDDTGATKDTSCFDGLLSNMQDSKDFKRGDVLIREWLNGRVDYCRFKEYIKDNELLQNHFYDDGYFYSIYKNGKWNNFSDLENVAINCSYIETLKFNWRKATKEEIDKLNELLGKEEEKDVYWLCRKNHDINFTEGHMYKQTKIGFDCINLIDDNEEERTIFGHENWFTKVKENKELEEAKEILKDWRFGKFTYSSDEIDRAIETILKHLEK